MLKNLQNLSTTLSVCNSHKQIVKVSAKLNRMTAKSRQLIVNNIKHILNSIKTFWLSRNRNVCFWKRIGITK